MSWIKIEEARINFNSKLTERNKAEGKPETEGHISQRELTKIIYPEIEKKNVSVYGKRLFEGGPGEKKMINIETVKELCQVLNTDPNFLFGHGE